MSGDGVHVSATFSPPERGRTAKSPAEIHLALVFPGFLKRRLVAAPLPLTQGALKQPNGGTRAPVTNDLVLTGGLAIPECETGLRLLFIMSAKTHQTWNLNCGCGQSCKDSLSGGEGHSGKLKSCSHAIVASIVQWPSLIVRGVIYPIVAFPLHEQEDASCEGTPDIISFFVAQISCTSASLQPSSFPGPKRCHT